MGARYISKFHNLGAEIITIWAPALGDYAFHLQDKGISARATYLLVMGGLSACQEVVNRRRHPHRADAVTGNCRDTAGSQFSAPAPRCPRGGVNRAEKSRCFPPDRWADYSLSRAKSRLFLSHRKPRAGDISRATTPIYQ